MAKIRKLEVTHVIKEGEVLPDLPPMFPRPVIKRQISYCGKEVPVSEMSLANPFHAAQVMARKIGKIVVCRKCLREIERNKDRNPLPERLNKLIDGKSDSI